MARFIDDAELVEVLANHNRQSNHLANQLKVTVTMRDDFGNEIDEEIVSCS